MKNLLKQSLFTIFTFITVFSFGQGLNIHGLVTNQTGDPYTNLHITLKDTITFQTIVVTTDASGEYHAIFNDALSDGVIRLTYYNCYNQLIEYNENYTVAQTEIIKDFNYCPGPCSIEIITDSSIPGVTTLNSIVSINNLESIEWSTGSHENSITVLNEDLGKVYWVKSYYSDGCFAYDDVFLDSPTNCDAQIYVYLDGQGNGYLNVYNNANDNTYLWSNGSTAASIIANDGENYCVTVTNGANCISSTCAQPSDSCSLYIWNSLENDGYLLEAIYFGIGTHEYLWSTGETTQSISVNFASPSEFYCVTVTNSFGCHKSQCFEMPNSTICSGSFYISDISGSEEIQLRLDLHPNIPATYIWDNGSAERSIITSGHGQYCVTATNALGCVYTGCYIHNGNDSCASTIFEDPNNSNALTVSSYGNNPFTYMWSNGSQEQYIQYTAEAVSVVVTDANGCWSTASYHGNDPDYKTIKGKLFPKNPNGTEHAKIYLIKSTVAPQQNDPYLEVIDSMSINYADNEMLYSFNDLQAGCYYLKGALEEGSSGYENNMPTYYGNGILWQDATCISIPNSQKILGNIYMIEGINPGGPGFIGGYVSEGAGFTSDDVKVRGEEPFVNANILLTTLNDVPVTHTLTDESGMYKFDSLAYGTYKVILEVAGEKTQLITITIGEESPSITNANLVRSTLKTSKTPSIKNFNIYPNPVNEQLNISFENTEFTDYRLSLYSIGGKMIENSIQTIHAGKTIINLKIDKLTPGLYFVTLTNKSGSNIIKFIKS